MTPKALSREDEKQSLEHAPNCRTCSHRTVWLLNVVGNQIGWKCDNCFSREVLLTKENK